VNCTASRCGNGATAPGEECDDGNAVNGDSCDVNCTRPRCGNGIVNRGEECDDGNAVNGDGCDTTCRPSGCGNGTVGPGEECDDGNTVSGDGCDANCTTSRCGNGVVVAGEECDDGTACCTAACERVVCEAACSDGTCDPIRGCQFTSRGGFAGLECRIALLRDAVEAVAGQLGASQTARFTKMLDTALVKVNTAREAGPGRKAIKALKAAGSKLKAFSKRIARAGKKIGETAAGDLANQALVLRGEVTAIQAEMRTP
jgi:cysteine-rich repeat protein